MNLLNNCEWFLLNISKVNRNGGVGELDLSPIKMESEGSIISIGTVGGLCFHLEAFKVTTIEGDGEARTTFNSLSKNLCVFSLH